MSQAPVISDDKRQAVLRAAQEVNRAKAMLEHAEGEFDKALRESLTNGNGHAPPVSVVMVSQDTQGKPLTTRIITVLRLHGRDMSNKELAEMLNKDAETIGATLSNLKKDGRVLNPSRGMWRLIER